MEERRVYPRLACICDVRYRVDGQAGVHQVSSRNLSASGVNLLLPARPPIGLSVDLELSLPGARDVMRAKGQVAWTEHWGDVYEGYYMTGITFTQIEESDQKRIMDFVATVATESSPRPCAGESGGS